MRPGDSPGRNFHFMTFQAKPGQRWHRQWKSELDSSDCIIELNDICIPIVIKINKNYSHCLRENKQVPEYPTPQFSTLLSIVKNEYTYTYLTGQDKPNNQIEENQFR